MEEFLKTLSKFSTNLMFHCLLTDGRRYYLIVTNCYATVANRNAIVKTIKLLL